MGTVYPKGSKLYIGFMLNGKQACQPSGFDVGDEEKAQKLLKKIEDRIQAGVEIVGKTDGPVTVQQYSKIWIVERRVQGLSDWGNDESRLRDHILSTSVGACRLGDMPLCDVRTRHILAVVKRARAKVAPKTLHNIYAVIRAFSATRSSLN